MKRSTRDELRVLFRTLVCDVNDVLTSRNVPEDVMWEMARRLHSTWREAMNRLETSDADEVRAAANRHPALSELLRLIDFEVAE